MEREIKFRAWHKTEKRMLYRTVWDKNWYLTPKNDENGCNCWREWKVEDQHWVEVMQHTGLKDKNGKEIYEGDVVRSVFIQPKEILNGEVIYSSGSFYLVSHSNNPRVQES